MRSLVTVLATTIMSMNLAMSQVHADEELVRILPIEEQAQDQQKNGEEHIQVGIIPMPKAERHAIKEFRAQKNKEEKSGVKLVEKTKDGQVVVPKAESWIFIDKPEKKEKTSNNPAAEVGVAFGKGESSAQASWNYSTTHVGAFHSVSYFSLAHDTIILEDGSNWMIYSGDRWKTWTWFASDAIVILPNDALFPLYDYKMVNQNTGDSIEVDLVLGPLVGLDYYIVSIDPFGYIYLNDGSYWRTSAFDSAIVSSWRVGETVIIGVNNGFLNLANPNILINVNRDVYATGECLY